MMKLALTLFRTPAEDMEHTEPEDLDVPDENGTNTIVLLRWECAPFDDEE